MLNKKVWIIVLSALALFGLVGGGAIFIHGEDMMGTSNNVPWGSLISGYEFLVVMSVGLALTASLGLVFGIKAFKPIAKRASAGAIATMLMAFVILGLELGNPLNMIYVLLSPNFNSPMVWMGVLYSSYLLFMVGQFYFLMTGDYQKARYAGMLVVAIAVVALVNIGGLFGFLAARPFWAGPFLAVYFIISAFLSGIAFLAITFYIISKVKKTEIFHFDGNHIVSTIGKFLALFLAFNAGIAIWKIITGIYGAVPGKYEAVMSLIAGPLSPTYWTFEIVLGIAVPLVLLLTKNGLMLARVFVAGLLTVIGIFAARIHFVFAGQIVPLEPVKGGDLPIYHTFSITWAESGLILGAVSGAVLLYMFAEHKWNLYNASFEYEEHKEKASAAYIKEA